VSDVDRPAALAVDLAAPLERAIAAGELAPLGAELLYFPSPRAAAQTGP
jgi:hypothetical protein